MENSENTEPVVEKTAELNTARQPNQPQVEAKEERNVLLGTISYTDENDYEKFLSSMDINQSLFVLIATANYGQSKGLFNLDESELVAKAIKTIKRNSTAASPADAPVSADTLDDTSKSEEHGVDTNA